MDCDLAVIVVEPIPLKKKAACQIYAALFAG
jgi:hypothetical protein